MYLFVILWDEKRYFEKRGCPNTVLFFKSYNGKELLNKVIWDLSVVSGEEEVNKAALFSDHKYTYLENLKENIIKLLTSMNLAKFQGVWSMYIK